MKKILITVSIVVFLVGLLPGELPAQLLRDYGDAPEGALAYPSLGIFGSFPTCLQVGPSTFVRHNNFGAWFGPGFDFEPDGNAGFCFFPPYDQDECFQDGDGGLLFPPAYTINSTPAVVPCLPGVQGPLGQTCQTAVWGVNVDIDVINNMPNFTDGWVNVLIDWNQDGQWGGTSLCPPTGIPAPEHVLVDFFVPWGFAGPLSLLGPPSFLIGPNSGYVWARFTITEQPVGMGWDGSGDFEDGESEDYLLLIDPGQQPTILPVLTECPEVTTECPEVETHCPELETWCPDDDPTICQITECPDNETFCPIEPTICPTIETECPVVETECPIYGDTYCPVATTFCPKVETLCPEEFTLCPDFAPTVCPYLDTECFQETTWCPIQPTLCPDAPTECFPAPTICEVLTSCPEDPTWCPLVQFLPTVCPIQYTACPEIPTSCFPTEATVCPYEFTVCPGDWTYCPLNPTYCPDIPTECPVVPTECAIIETACGIVPTECPTVEVPTECPILDTFCPDNDPTVCETTQCPVTDTLCPVDPTYCPLIDADGDGVGDCNDNCITTPNPGQEDTYPPPSGNNCGDACECEGNFDDDQDQDGSDAAKFKADFGRSPFSRPCTDGDPCNGDFDCDGDVDGTDAALFKSDFGRSPFSNPCPYCPTDPWCNYIPLCDETGTTVCITRMECGGITCCCCDISGTCMSEANCLGMGGSCN